MTSMEQAIADHLRSIGPVINTYDKLWLTVNNREMRSRGCGYWYVVQHDNYAHTAFRTKEGLRLWLSRRGLVLGNGWDHVPTPPEDGEDIKAAFGIRIKGAYQTAMHGCIESMLNREGELIPVLSNGDITMGLLEVPEGGIGPRIVHFFNPNEKRRPVIGWAHLSAEEADAV